MALDRLQNLRILLGEAEFSRVQEEGALEAKTAEMKAAESVSMKHDITLPKEIPPVLTSKAFTSQWPIWDEPKNAYSSSDDSYAARAPAPVSSSKKSKGKKKESTNTMPDPDPANREIGNPSPIDMTFCPILAVSKFPYKFMSSSSAFVSDEVSRQFFAAEMFWRRKWTM